MDKVYLRDLRVFTVIGVHPWEQVNPRPVLMNLEAAWDNRQPAQTDDLAKALDYDAMATVLREVAANNRFQLLETLAEQCADTLMAGFGLSWVRLDLFKPGAVRDCAGAGVLIERGKPPLH